MRLTLPFEFANPRGGVLGVALLASLCLPQLRAAAQEPNGSDPRATYATRAELEAEVRAAERDASDRSVSPGERGRRRGEALMLRYRLEQGDFAVGDRIIVDVVGDAALTDTFTVRSGPTLHLANLPSISLTGVLRSELDEHLTAELSRYLQQPTVRVVPLLRVAIMGEVGRPGYYHVPADILLSDVLMMAGGPAGSADLGRSQIRRGDDALLGSGHFAIALTEGLSLDALHLRSGDEVLLRERRRFDWRSILQTVTLASGVLSLIVSLSN